LIAHISGELALVEADHVVIDVGGVGYKVFAPLSVITEMPHPGSKTKLFTYMAVKEDSITLYGFTDREQQSLFELLLTVSGIGPKVALNVLSALTVEHVVDANSREDHAALNRVQGVGAKTAQRIVLELREKITTLVWAQKAFKAAKPDERAAIEDVIEGLIGWGYSRNDAKSAAEQAIKNVKDKTDTASIIRVALKHLTSG
jgi:Holliday junction DNA helicase RuvA